MNAGAIVLAAGAGTRMKSDDPKVVHALLGRPMICYVLDAIRQVGLRDCVVVAGYGRDRVAAVVAEKARLVVQKTLAGTGDAVRLALEQGSLTNDEILICCGDTPLLRPRTLKKLLTQRRRRKAAAAVLTAIVDNPRGYGRILRDDQGDVIGIVEEKEATPKERQIKEINTGVFVFKRACLEAVLPFLKRHPHKNEYYLTDCVGLLHRRGERVIAVETQDAQEALGVNNRRDLAEATQILNQRILERLMDRGVTIESPQTTFVAADARIGRDTVIRPFTVIEPNVVVGPRCRLGPFCRLRPGVRLASDVEIGNFTEVSRSRLGRGVVVKHFSFLGDAFIADEVNVGAGTVTANYDGTSKNPTRIGRKAFIGSDTVLIAPVRIGTAAKTGAGAVVKAGTVVPPNTVAVGVPARIIGESEGRSTSLKRKKRRGR